MIIVFIACQNNNWHIEEKFLNISLIIFRHLYKSFISQIKKLKNKMLKISSKKVNCQPIRKTKTASEYKNAERRLPAIGGGGDRRHGC